MFTLDKNKNYFINRGKKNPFNSVVIPTELQKPQLKQKEIYLHKIDEEMNHKWKSINIFKKLNDMETIYKNKNKIKKIVKVIINNPNSHKNIIDRFKKFQQEELKDNLTLIKETELKEPTNLMAISDPENRTISVSFTEPYSNEEILNYLYSINWNNYEPLNPVQNKSPIIIKNIENGESYIVALKTKTKNGISSPSKPISVFTGLLGFPNE
jgi:hypothetical protein